MTKKTTKRQASPTTSKKEPIYEQYISMIQVGSKYIVKQAIVDVANNELVKVERLAEPEPKALARERMRSETVKRFFK